MKEKRELSIKIKYELLLYGLHIIITGFCVHLNNKVYVNKTFISRLTSVTEYAHGEFYVGHQRFCILMLLVLSRTSLTWKEAKSAAGRRARGRG